jgi:hypothetical protein
LNNYPYFLPEPGIGGFELLFEVGVIGFEAFS